VKTFEMLPPKVFETVNPTWVVFWKLILTGRSGYMVSPSTSTKMASDGGHGSSVGESVGEPVGEAVGEADGDAVGEPVGSSVGVAVGDVDGYMLSVG